jgi:two-component system LytT family sensor kinase
MDDIAYRRATARVAARLAFYRHAIVYLLVNLFLVVWNLVREPNHLWFQWVIFGWGIGLVAHAVHVYSYRWFGSRREKLIQL